MQDSDKKSLWAPWRIEFILSPKDGRCFLCGKKDDFSSVEEELIVFRGETAFVIMNRYPYNSGHLMVCPYRHVASLSELDQRELCEIAKILSDAEKNLTRILRPDGINMGLNLGAAAGAGVKDHIHFHVVPRWIGDTNFMPVISDTRVVPEALLKTAAKIREGWKTE